VRQTRDIDDTNVDVAKDNSAALENSQDMRWRETPPPIVLVTDEATKAGIIPALAAL
jgi:hypothetical protein